MSAPRPYLSLLWKAIIGGGIILITLIMLYTYYNVQQLSRLYAQQTHQHHQRLTTEFTGLVERSAQLLSNIIDTLPSLHNDTLPLAQRIEKNWFNLQITWGIEGIEILDAKGESLGKWGDAWHTVQPEALDAARQFGARSRYVSCQQQCFLSLISPILDENDTLRIARVSVSLADLIVDFKHISGSDIGFLVRASASPSSTPSGAFWKIASLSNRQSLEPLLQQAISNTTLTPVNGTSSMQYHQESAALDRIHDIFFIYDQTLLGEGAMVTFLTDVSTQKEQISDSRNVYLFLGAAVSAMAIVLMVVVLWRPLTLLRILSSTLPLLPSGKFDLALQKLANDRSKRLFRDELSELKVTTVEVSQQLQRYREHIAQNQERLTELAHFDQLTGLINRSRLLDLIAQHLQASSDQSEGFCVMVLDLDDFKDVNEGYGHQYGDALLECIANRLKACMQNEDHAARLGGDEFCLVLNKVSTIAQVEAIVRRIHRALEEPVQVNHRNVPVSCSIGVALSPQHGNDTNELLQKADLALYRAKAKGKNTHHVFTEDLLRDADARLALESELRLAVKESQFELHYQPQIRLLDQKLIGFEALIRWRHPERGLLAPFHFIDALESNGLIVAVGNWVIDTACRQLADWCRAGHTDMCMSINLSVRQFSDPQLLNHVRQAILSHNINPRQLEFEVTESLLATNITLATELLSALQGLGCTIAIDDFGTGYSSLAYLKQLPLDKLKVDRTFVKDLPEDADDKQICSAIIAMARNLGLKVVAEGIETEAQRAFLSNLECEIGQGYLFNKPLDARTAGQIYQLHYDNPASADNPSTATKS